jgi:hypothetical protein
MKNTEYSAKVVTILKAYMEFTMKVGYGFCTSEP